MHKQRTQQSPRRCCTSTGCFRPQASSLSSQCHDDSCKLSVNLRLQTIALRYSVYSCEKKKNKSPLSTLSHQHYSALQVVSELYVATVQVDAILLGSLLSRCQLFATQSIADGVPVHTQLHVLLCEQPEEVGVLLLQESKPLALKREKQMKQRDSSVLGEGRDLEAAVRTTYLLQQLCV